MIVLPKLRPTESLSPGVFYLFSGKVDAVVLGAKPSDDGLSMGVPLGASLLQQDGAYKLQRIDPSRCFEISEGQIELAAAPKVLTGQSDLILGSIAISKAGASIAIIYGDWNDLGWMDIDSGEIQSNDLAFRHFFSEWALVAPRGNAQKSTFFARV
jgi:hypothetical protein